MARKRAVPPGASRGVSGRRAGKGGARREGEAGASGSSARASSTGAVRTTPPATATVATVSQSSAPSALTRAEWIAGLAAFAVAVVLRVVELGDLRAYDIDEAHMVLLAQGSLGEIVARLQTEAYPPLWFFLEGLWTGLWGVSEVASRSLSVLFALATIPGVFYLGRRVVGDRPALYAAVLLGAAPLHVFFSREARMYALLVLGAFLVFWLLERATERNRRRDWVALGVALTATAYVHTYGLFLFAAAAACLALPRFRARAAPLLVTLGVALAAHAPWIPTILAQSATGGESWMAGFFRDLPGWAAPLRSLELLGAGGAYPPMNYALAENADLRWPAAAAYAAVLAWFAWTPAVKRSLKVSIGLFLLVPLTLPWLWSLVVRPIYVAGRYDVMVIPFFVLALGLGLNALRPLVRYPLIASFLVLSAYTLYPMYAHSPALPAPARAAYILEHTAPGELVLHTDIVGETLRIEFLKEGAGVPVRSFPAVTDEHPGWIDYERLDRAALVEEADALAAALREAGRPFWLVFPTRDDVTDILVVALDRHFAVDPDRTAGHLAVAHFVPRP